MKPNIITSNQVSGGPQLSHHLFAVKTSENIWSLATKIGEYCNCTFYQLDDFVLKSPFEAHFPMLYAQFEPITAPHYFGVTPLEYVNLVIFKNKASFFDKKEGLAKKTKQVGTLPFVDDGTTCYAFRNKGLYFASIPKVMADYFIFIFAHKDNLICHQLSERFAAMNPLQNIDLSDAFSQETLSHNAIFLFKNIFKTTENQIRQQMRKLQIMHLGKIPDSLRKEKEKYAFLNISVNELIINNL